MKKIVILITLLSFNLSAEYLMRYNNNNYCVDSYSIIHGTSRIDVILSSNKKLYSLTLAPEDLTAGYTYDGSTCNKLPVLVETNLSFENYNFLIALTALLSGFITLFFMIYISIEVAKK